MKEGNSLANYRKAFFDNKSSSTGWYKCVGCGQSFRKEDIEIDHILPQSKGGGNSTDNLQCMCRSCNASKGDDTTHSVDDYIWNNSGAEHPGHEVDDFINNSIKSVANKGFFNNRK